MAKQIDIEINLDNLERSIGKLAIFELQFQKAVDDGLEEFSHRFRDKLVENISKYGLPVHDILASIHIYQADNTLVISSNDEQLAYIEYGVGLIGSQSPHPKWTDWQYDINEHGYKGWVYYPETDMDFAQNDVIIRTIRGSTIAWTRGHEARPFLYHTWLWGTRSIHQIVMKHVRRIKID